MADPSEDEIVANESTCNSAINDSTYNSPNQQSTPLHPNHSIDTNDYNGSVARDGTPVISGVTGDYFRPSDVYQSVSQDYTNTVGDSYTTATSRRRRERRVLSEPPTAKDSAFSGPPRYDWIDIETAATVKIQSIVRRNQVMDDLARKKVSTAAMRNRARAKANSGRKTLASEDVPGFFRFCGIGLLFGEATGEDQEVLNAREKDRHRKKKEIAEMKDAEKRRLRLRRRASDHMLESVEVVEDVSTPRFKQ